MALCSSRALAFVTITGLLASAGAADAATLSFASDDDSTAFTLIGIQNSATTINISNGRSPDVTPVILRVDDDNMSQPTFSVAAALVMNLTASYAGSVGSGNQTHTYNINGTFSYVRQSDGAPLVTVRVNGGSTLAVGGTATTWGSAGAMFGSDFAAGSDNGVAYDTSGLELHMIQQGLSPSQYGFSFQNLIEDFSFSMTLVSRAGQQVEIDPNSRLPLSWESEASYSGHVVAIPTPGAAGLMGLTALGAAKRGRRRRTR